jgi:hypothetical protein
VASSTPRKPNAEQHGVRHVRPATSEPKHPDDTDQAILRAHLDEKTGQLSGPLSLLL